MSIQWLSARFRSVGASVDRQANILRGYVIAQEGPFKSEGRGEFDKESLEALVKLGSTKPAGLKSRFTHPDMSSDGLGNFLGRAKNLRMDFATDARTGKRVNAVRGDLHFDSTALDTPPKGGKPLGVYVMDLAESDPDALSSSIVVKANQEFRQKKDGTLETDEAGEPLPPLWRPYELHASDIVDTGDAVDGLLSIDDLPASTLWKGELLLNQLFDGKPREFVEQRLASFAKRYLDRTYGEPEPAVPAPRLAAARERMMRAAYGKG